MVINCEAYPKHLQEQVVSALAHTMSGTRVPLPRISVVHVKPLEILASAIADCMSNYEHVEHPSHYNTYPMETIDMMVDIWGKDKVADWCEITAFKYRMRMGTKPDNSIEQDLKKEQWYLNKAKELRNECVE